VVLNAVLKIHLFSKLSVYLDVSSCQIKTEQNKIQLFNPSHFLQHKTHMEVSEVMEMLTKRRKVASNWQTTESD